MDYAKRRRVLAAEMQPRSVAVIMNPEPSNRSADQDYAYRPDSNMLYLCGLDEPGAVALQFSKDLGGEFHVFVLPKDPERERWVGPRYGAEGARAVFGADAAHDISQLREELEALILPLDAVYFDFTRHALLSTMLFELTQKLRKRGRRASEGPRAFKDLNAIVHEQRRIKDADEIALMRKAAAVTVAGFQDVLAMLKPGIGEWMVEAALYKGFRSRGASGLSFGSICAGGNHATTLHYEENRDTVADGELILIDAGADVGGYAGDISRTFPVNGRFSAAQREIYELVLRAQKAGIEACVVGNHLMSPHQRVREIYAEGLAELGIIAETPADILEKNLDFAYFMHGTSHYLGIDTHDCGTGYHRGSDAPATLEAGVVITVEPGLYFSLDDLSVPERYRGIGVRIEDDILITEAGPENLTQELIKEIDEIEAAMQARKQ